jgi:hypothetical protein
MTVLARNLTLFCEFALAVSCLHAEQISFNNQILPILSDRCFACHGPDSAARKAELRLDKEEIAKTARKKSGVVPIVPEQPGKSAILHRMTSDDPDELMPPPDSKLTVSEAEISLIRQWIEQGATWERHWAFIPPEKEALPEVERGDWPENEIDHFVLARLEAEGLKPSSPAGKEHLLRRLTFDLTGLPPTLNEMDAFLADESGQAVESAVDRLLESKAFGERLALEWLDVARYGDTDGLFEDHPRTIYPWRDWVVNAFNENLPYSDFISWQLAGDLYPESTIDQKVATGFLRNNTTSNEGGIIDEDYRIKYLIDRVNTTATAFLGLTMECAQCHDHKFDPMTQREYYEFGGFFNSLVGKGNTKGAAAPTIRLTSPEQDKRLAKLGDEISSAETELKESPAEFLADFDKWNATLERPVEWQRPKIVSSSLNEKPRTYSLTLERPEGELAAIRISADRPAVIDSIQLEAVVDKKKRELGLDGELKFKISDEPKILGLKEVASLAESEQLILTIVGDPIAIEATGDKTATSRASLPKEHDKRLAHFRNEWSGFKPDRKKLAALKKEKGGIEGSVPISMIAADEAEKRDAHILMRGEYDKPGVKVSPAAPASIMGFADDLPKNRLGLALWITDTGNPLAARFAVNRYWQMLFGTGIVKTSEDFGTQGERPSHQALLDYLSVDFVENGWNVKRLIRKMVTSATYQQASIKPPDSDSGNRLLSYAPRQRLAAEFVRDHALAVSGLLVDKQGGPGVHPYQPGELFGPNAIGASNAKFNISSGDGLYRRSLYTYWKRQIPAANMRILGADGRTACKTRRERTNTPLQALVLLNGPQFVEAARIFGERMMIEGGDTAGERIAFAFRLATSRRATEGERSILVAEFQDRLTEFKADPEAAAKYLNGGGVKKPPEHLDSAELAAYAAVASLILNLDEAISKS